MMASQSRLKSFARKWLAVGCCLVAAFAGGCDSGPPHADISGTITFDGKPIEKGAITFFPLDGKSQPAGSEIKDGAYKTKVGYGEWKVVISASKVVGTRRLYPNNPKEVMPLTAEALPERYNEKSELKLDVKERTILKDYELTK